jgi:hypothetical protein
MQSRKCSNCSVLFLKKKNRSQKQWDNGCRYCSPKCYWSALKGKHTPSFIHGFTRSRFYEIWSGIKKRCLNKNCPAFPNYGGRGITLSKEWKSFTSFKNSMHESYLEAIKANGEANISIDRINNDDGYSKENCRWATRTEQANNRRGKRLLTFIGKSQNAKAWSQELKIPYVNIRSRIARGWSDERILTQPILEPGATLKNYDALSPRKELHGRK